MRYILILVCMLSVPVTPAMAQLSIGFGSPSLSIGIDLPIYPDLVRVPGYPVYYAPEVNSNYFFYDGMYWVYDNDSWYASSWYNGPWSMVDEMAVPVFLLRVPVRYYRRPPQYFEGWTRDAPPRWGDHWGEGWQRQHSGWDHWNRSSAPAPAPLPAYQRQYSRERYPSVERQRALSSQSYRYQPHDALVRQHYQQASVPRTPMDAGHGQPAPQDHGQHSDAQRSQQKDQQQAEQRQHDQQQQVQQKEQQQHRDQQQGQQRQQAQQAEQRQHEQQQQAQQKDPQQHGEQQHPEPQKGQQSQGQEHPPKSQEHQP